MSTERTRRAGEASKSNESKDDNEKDTANDPLLRALRDLPVPAIDAPHAKRGHAAAKAAFMQAFDAPWHVRMFGGVARVALPVGLAAVVGVYMMWAIGIATTIVH